MIDQCVIVLGDGGHRGTGYVMAHQLFKLFDLLTWRWPIRLFKLKVKLIVSNQNIHMKQQFMSHLVNVI